MPCCGFDTVPWNKDEFTQIDGIAERIDRACAGIGYGEGSGILRTGAVKVWHALA